MPSPLIVLVFALLGPWSRPPVGPACTAVTVNRDCIVSIDREQAVTPLPVRARAGATVTVLVSKRPLEQIVTQQTVVETAPVDELAEIFAALLPSLESTVFRREVSPSGDRAAEGREAPAGHERARTPPSGEGGQTVQRKLSEIRSAQEGLAADLAAFQERVKRLGRELAAVQDTKANEWTVEGLLEFRQRFCCAVLAPDAATPGRACGSGEPLRAARLPVGSLRVLDEDVAAARKAYASLPAGDREALKDDFDAVAGAQEWLSGRVKVLAAAESALAATAAVLDRMNPASVSTTDRIRLRGGAAGGTRASTVRITAQDLVTKAVVPLATLVVNWGSSRWELSTGALFSRIPSSTFQASPVIEDGVQKVDEDGDPISVIAESTTTPTIVPAVFAHYRVAEKAAFGGSRRLAILASAAVGVNPYSGSADVAAGLTFSYRGLVVSPMAHAARPLRLTSGLYPGQVFAGPPPHLTTERYWDTRFALGLSYRIPIR